MKKQFRRLAPAAIAVMATLPGMTQAAGTAAGSEITNTATLNYQINGVDQEAVTAQDMFNVDIKVDFALTRLNTTAPNETSLEADNVVVAAVQITNDGNAPTSFIVNAADQTGTSVDINGTTYTDTIDSGGAYSYYLDNPLAGTQGVLDPEDTLLNGSTGEIAADDTVTVFVTVPKSDVTGVDGDAALSSVTVNGYESSVNGTLYSLDTDDNDPTNGSVDNSAVPNGATTIEVVFADTESDNSESLTDVLVLVFPNLEGDGVNSNLTKSSVVISDPINGTDNPKAIPGAIVEYTISLTNTGTADATNVVVSDELPADTTFLAEEGIKVAMDGATDPVIVDASIASYDEDSRTVTVNLGTLDGGPAEGDDETNVIVFRVTIN